MDYLRTLTLAEQQSLQSKADRDKTTIQAMLDTKVAQYLADVERDNGQNVDAEIAKRLAIKTQIEKAALLLTL